MIRGLKAIDYSGFAESIVRDAKELQMYALYFIASTKVSTIPGISIAGSDPNATLYTPTLDVEYLTLGKPKTLDIIPVTPDGIPTPAVLTRASLKLLKIPYLIVNCGAYIEPQVPHVSLPGRSVGGRIDVEDALPTENVIRLYSSGKTLGLMIGKRDCVFIVGESIPGGTTTAMSIMEALGYRASGRVSSASPENPHNLKIEVFAKALKRRGLQLPVKDVFDAVAIFGDPLHISIAGFVSGAIEQEAKVLLAGGTQMCAVLAILKKLSINIAGKVAIATTRWIVEDNSADMAGLVKDIAPEIPILYPPLSFVDTPYSGLMAYEKGYVKEGVGAGGTIVGALIKGFDINDIKKSIYSEYQALVTDGYVSQYKKD